MKGRKRTMNDYDVLARQLQLASDEYKVTQYLKKEMSRRSPNMAVVHGLNNLKTILRETRRELTKV